jgi:hypothetical protein
MLTVVLELLKENQIRWQIGWKVYQQCFCPWMEWEFIGLFGATKWQTSFWWVGIIQNRTVIRK